MENDAFRVELRESIEKLGVSQRTAAKMFGVSFSTLKRWFIGENEVPKHAIVMSRTWIEFPETRKIAEL